MLKQLLKEESYMGFKHTLKVILSTIIVVILVLMAVYAFIFRNEISQKIMAIAKKTKGDNTVEQIKVNTNSQDKTITTPIEDEKTNKGDISLKEDEKISITTHNKKLQDDVPYLDTDPKKTPKLAIEEPETKENSVKSSKTKENTVKISKTKYEDVSDDLPDNLPDGPVVKTKGSHVKASTGKTSTQVLAKKKRQGNKGRKAKYRKSRYSSKASKSRLERRVRFLEAKLGVKTKKTDSLSKRVERLERAYLKKNR
jgi:hypothetical protein